MPIEDRTMEDRSLSIGRVFSRAFSVMGNNPLVTFGVAFLLGALPQLAVSYATTGMRIDLTQRGATAGIVGLGILSFVLALVFQALVQGVIVHTTLVDREGRRATFGESMGFALGRALPLLVVSVLFAVAAMIGLMLLIVPFFFVVTRWAVAASAVVAERSGVGGAFSRSAELTAGARWKILGLGIVVIIVVWVISAIAGVVGFAAVGLSGIATMALNPVVMIVSAIANTLTSTFWATMQASLYVELIDWKDGPTAQRLAEIFR
jgi:hypothetical protein